jgi:HlyD family secretion protein
MNRWARRLLVLLVIAVVIIALRLTIWRPGAVPVEVFAVETGRVESTVVNSRAGTVESRLRAEMSPGIAGLVSAIPVEKGESVRRGQVLLQIDDAEHRANARLADRSLEAARATAREAILDADQAERDLQRAQGLAARDLASDQDLEDAQTRALITLTECTVAEARAAQAEAALELARATLGLRSTRRPCGPPSTAWSSTSPPRSASGSVPRRPE